ncbi:hypothetical protein DXG01_000830 [Tephrocybe rancida]|nr:hypothetical protein DXG01_000830 [Tephrocybe rancida]
MEESPATSRSVSVDSRGNPSLFRRSLHAVGDVLSPFSAAAVASLPKLARPKRYQRADAIPDAPSNDEGEMPTVRDYHAINSLPPQVRVPKKIRTPVKVEAKVWFANERTWVAWLNIAILIGTLALALFNASKDEIATRFAYGYALISVCVLVYAFALYQYRISMIRRRDPGHFAHNQTLHTPDAIAGPVILGIVLFTLVLANFIVRVRELYAPLSSPPIHPPDHTPRKRKEVPIPGAGLFSFLSGTSANSTLGLYTQP